MAYEIEKTYTNFWGWISDDEWIWRGESSVADMDGIDVQTQERYTTLMDDYSKWQFWNMNAPLWMKSNNNSSAFITDGTTIYNPSWSSSSSTVWLAIGMEVYGTWVDSIGYIFWTTGIQKVTYDWTNVWTPITTNYPSTVTVDSKIGWHVTNLLFSAWDKIYFLDTINNYVNFTLITTTVGATNASTTITTNDTTGWTRGATVTGTGIPANTTIVSIINNTSAVLSNAFTGTTGNVSIKIGRDVWVLQLMPWTKVKYIYSYSYDTIIVVTTNGNSTFVYELEFTGWGYSIVSRIERESVLAISALGNEYSVYIATNHWIYQYQGRQMQYIKYMNLSSPKLWYDRQLIIVDNWVIYKLGNIKPWRNAILTKITPSTGVSLIDGSTIISSIYLVDRYALILEIAPKRTNKIDLIITDWWINQVQKSDIYFRLGYMFESGNYNNPTTKQEIEVLIQTDGMYMINTVNYISVWKVTDSTNITWPDSIGNPKYWYLEIQPQEIVNALQTAWYPSTFWFVKVRILLKAWDEYTGNPWYYEKAPRLYDFNIKSNYVKR